MKKEISMRIENNLIIWSPSDASPDINRQVPKKGVNLSSLKAVTVPTVLYSEFKINPNDLSYIDLGEFWININKLKDHLLEVKSNIPSLIFAGKVDNKVYDSVLFNKGAM